MVARKPIKKQPSLKLPCKVRHRPACSDGDQPSVKIVFQNLLGKIKFRVFTLHDCESVTEVASFIADQPKVIRLEPVDFLKLPDDIRYLAFQSLVENAKEVPVKCGEQQFSSLLEYWLSLTKTKLLSIELKEIWRRGSLELACLTYPSAPDVIAESLRASYRTAGLHVPTIRQLTKQLGELSGEVGANGAPTPVDAVEGFLFSLRPLAQSDETEVAPYLVHYREEWFVFTNGQWRQQSLGNLRNQVTNYIAAKWPKNASQRFVGDVLAVLVARTTIATGDHSLGYRYIDGGWQPADILGCQNGVLDMSATYTKGKSPKLLLAAPGNFVPIVLPVEYDPRAKAPRFERFLSEVLPAKSDKDKRIKVVQEMLGYCLAFTKLRLEKFFLLYGEGGNGKSVLMEMICGIFGEQNIGNLTLDQLQEKFLRRTLVEKLVNIGADMRMMEFSDEQTLKLITSFERHTLDQKYREPSSSRIFAKLIFSTNVLPQFRDSSDGIYRRLLLIPFLENFQGREDTTLIQTLRGELPGILNWAIAGLKRLVLRKRFIRCSVCRRALTRFRTDVDTVLSFLEEKCIRGAGHSVEASTLYRKYRCWCEDNGRQSLASSKFRQRMKNLKMPRCRPGSGLERPRMYSGVNLISQLDR